MKLKDLLRDLECKVNENIEVSSITTDSRDVAKNSLFIAIEGVDVDGHTYISEAIYNGAVVIVHEKHVPELKRHPKTIFIKVSDSRKAAAIIASNYYGNVHRKMTLVGITGTNGKTTTSELTYQLLKELKKNVGIISTVSAKFSNSEIDTGYHVTTPSSVDLHRIMAAMYKGGCEYLIIETTSHGLDQNRTWGINFEISVVTNVTPEHLDYHGNFNRYINTKTKIFKQSKLVFLNKFDPSLHKLIKRLPTQAQYVVVDHTKLKLPKTFSDRFPGHYNLENAALAHAAVKHLTGIDTVKYFGGLESVEGRMEFIKTKKNFKVAIDFAHDDIALENVLNVARKVTKNRLIVVFGCAGLRDKAKRPKMGLLAVKYADQTVITAEDPRTEILTDIIKEIEAGALKAGAKVNSDYFTIEDRQEAIDFAINNLARRGDLVLITGKGHERSMCFGTKEYPWSDQNAVIKALKR